MGVHVDRLREFVSRFGDRGQSRAAQALGITKSTLSRILNDEAAAKRVQWHTAERMARSANKPAKYFWDEIVYGSTVVPRETSGAFREGADSSEASRDERDSALRAIEEMALALAKIARDARLGSGDK